MPESLAGSIKAAAIQLEAIVGDVTTNLSRLELMIREAGLKATLDYLQRATADTVKK